jgi:Spy/CpxP family protein refolding chaperone
MKNRMPKICAFLATAAMLTASTASAGPPEQEGPWRMGPAGPEQRLARLSEQLDLSPEQSLQVLELLQAAADDHEAVRERFVEQFGPEICAIRQNTEAEILALLTPGQVAQFELLRAQGAEKQTRQRKGPKAHPDCTAFDG